MLLLTVSLVIIIKKLCELIWKSQPNERRSRGISSLACYHPYQQTLPIIFSK